jgi:mitochondrial import inner membrane translocase subunit TIM23
LGVINLMYIGMESAMVSIRDRDNSINNVAAGLGTSAVFTD